MYPNSQFPLYFHPTTPLPQMMTPALFSPGNRRSTITPKASDIEFSNDIKNFGKIDDDENKTVGTLCKRFVKKASDIISDNGLELDYNISYSDRQITILQCYYDTTYINVSKIIKLMEKYPKVKSMLVNFSSLKNMKRTPVFYWAIEHVNSDISKHAFLNKKSGGECHYIIEGMNEVVCFGYKKLESVGKLIKGILEECITSIGKTEQYTVVYGTETTDYSLVVSIKDCRNIVNLCDIQNKLNRWNVENANDLENVNEAKLYCSSIQSTIKIRFTKKFTLGRKRGRNNEEEEVVKDEKSCRQVKKKKLEDDSSEDKKESEGVITPL